MLRFNDEVRTPDDVDLPDSVEASQTEVARMKDIIEKLASDRLHTDELDDDTEEILDQLVKGTGQSISSVFKQGLLALRDQLAEQGSSAPYEIYRDLDLGPGGYAIAPSTETRRGVQEAIRRKLGR